MYFDIIKEKNNNYITIQNN